MIITTIISRTRPTRPNIVPDRGLFSRKLLGAGAVAAASEAEDEELVMTLVTYTGPTEEGSGVDTGGDETGGDETGNEDVEEGRG